MTKGGGAGCIFAMGTDEVRSQRSTDNRQQTTDNRQRRRLRLSTVNGQQSIDNRQRGNGGGYACQRTTDNGQRRGLRLSMGNAQRTMGNGQPSLITPPSTLNSQLSTLLPKL